MEITVVAIPTIPVSAEKDTLAICVRRHVSPRNLTLFP